MLVFLAFLGIIAAPWGLECSFIERLTHVLTRVPQEGDIVLWSAIFNWNGPQNFLLQQHCGGSP